MGFEPTTSCLGSKHSSAELHPPVASKCSQELFTSQLLNEFITSRSAGTSPKTVVHYHYALDRMIGYPLTPEGINDYLNNLPCHNGKHNYYRVIKNLCRWAYRCGRIANNPIENISPPKRQKKLLPAISKEQLDTILAHCNCERDKAILNLLWYSGMRVSECATVKAQDFNWEEGTVVVLGKGNIYRKALAGNGIVNDWFTRHDSFGITTRGIKTMIQRLSRESGIKFSAHALRRGMAIHNLKRGLSTRVVQALGGWETISMVERYSKSLTFDDALSVYSQMMTNGAWVSEGSE
jgi:site-specific recombinase XerD